MSHLTVYRRKKKEPPPPAEEQKDIIRSVIRSKPFHVGDEVFIIDNAWWGKWIEYTRYDHYIPNSQVKLSKKPRVPTRGNNPPPPVDPPEINPHPVPPPIDNLPLYDPRDKTYRYFRIFLCMVSDYVVLPLLAGKKLAEWYGGGPIITRKLVDVSEQYNIQMPLLGPYVLCLFIEPLKNEFPIIYIGNQSLTMGEFVHTIAKQYKMNYLNLRLTHYANRIRGKDFTRGTKDWHELWKLGIRSGTTLLIDERPECDIGEDPWIYRPFDNLSDYNYLLLYQLIVTCADSPDGMGQKMWDALKKIKLEDHLFKDTLWVTEPSLIKDVLEMKQVVQDAIAPYKIPTWGAPRKKVRPLHQFNIDWVVSELALMNAKEKKRVPVRYHEVGRILPYLQMPGDPEEPFF